jgi:transcriptional regulator with XRE-family HTH domain
MIDAPKAKYLETRELIQHASNHGLTQKEIAKKCGVTQSIVSDWLNGKRIARRIQLTPLLDMFGDVTDKKQATVYLVANHECFKINTSVLKVFHDFLGKAEKSLKAGSRWHKYFTNKLPEYRRPPRITDPELRERFESEIKGYEEAIVDLERVRALYNQEIAKEKTQLLRDCRLELISNLGKSFTTQSEFLAPFDKLSSDDFQATITVGDFKNLKNDSLAASHSYKSEVVQIYGDIIFEYTFDEEPEDPGPMWNRNDDRVPWMKWVIHELGNGQFCWLVMQPKNVFLNIKTNKHPNNVWLSKIEKSDTVESILSSAQDYLSAKVIDYLIDPEALLFLITKSFLDRGYPVENVKVINGPAIE